MRQIIGNRTVEFPAADFAPLRRAYPGGVVLDVGTGDGKHARFLARC